MRVAVIRLACEFLFSTRYTLRALRVFNIDASLAARTFVYFAGREKLAVSIFLLDLRRYFVTLKIHRSLESRDASSDEITEPFFLPFSIARQRTGKILDLCRSELGQLIVRWHDYITSLVL